MRRLEELLRQMCQAAKAIGNTELENKFAEGNDNNNYYDNYNNYFKDKIENSWLTFYEDVWHNHWSSYSTCVQGFKKVEKFCLTLDMSFTNDYEMCNLSFATILFQELSK